VVVVVIESSNLEVRVEVVEGGSKWRVHVDVDATSPCHDAELQRTMAHTIIDMPAPSSGE
jgi:hypothetical protein